MGMGIKIAHSFAIRIWADGEEQVFECNYSTSLIGIDLPHGIHSQWSPTASNGPGGDKTIPDGIANVALQGVMLETKEKNPGVASINGAGVIHFDFGEPPEKGFHMITGEFIY